MKTLRELLQQSDPVAHEPPLSEDEVRHMRRVVLTAPVSARWAMPRGRTTAVLGVGLAAVVVAAVGLRPYESRDPADPDPPVIDREMLPRQLQFDTPGGTRVIWVLHSASEPWR
jgi:hypothetical protein